MKNTGSPRSIIAVLAKNLRCISLIAVALTTAMPGCAGAHKAQPQPQPGQLTYPKSSRLLAAEDEWKISIVSFRLTAAGHMLDLRYRVTDPEKAAALLGPATRAFIVHDRTGLVFGVPSYPKLGRLQQTKNPPLVGRVYTMILDAGGVIKRGDTVTLIIGEAFFEGIVVQ